jgi:hypothetical protein
MLAVSFSRIRQVDAMSTSIGILIIGSLYWDEREHRTSWRERRLRTEDAVRVRVPIRYGRRSETRGNSYTMVYSGELGTSDDTLGVAWVVPCRRPVRSAGDLFAEAEALWAAEQPPDSRCGGIASDWGGAAIVRNPGCLLEPTIQEAWEARVAAEQTCGLLPHAGKGEPPVDAAGILNIAWPAGAPPEFSVLLAAVTAPTLRAGRYPSVEQIVEGWTTAQGSKHRNYFVNNRKHGIRTFQDEAIAQRLGGGSA